MKLQTPYYKSSMYCRRKGALGHPSFYSTYYLSKKRPLHQLLWDQKPISPFYIGFKIFPCWIFDFLNINLIASSNLGCYSTISLPLTVSIPLEDIFFHKQWIQLFQFDKAKKRLNKQPIIYWIIILIIWFIFVQQI